MCPSGFENTIQASERPQTHNLESTATGNDKDSCLSGTYRITTNFRHLMKYFYNFTANVHMTGRTIIIHPEMSASSL